MGVKLSIPTRNIINLFNIDLGSLCNTTNTFDEMVEQLSCTIHDTGEAAFKIKALVDHTGMMATLFNKYNTKNQVKLINLLDASNILIALENFIHIAMGRSRKESSTLYYIDPIDSFSNNIIDVMVMSAVKTNTLTVSIDHLWRHFIDANRIYRQISRHGRRGIKQIKLWKKSGISDECVKHLIQTWCCAVVICLNLAVVQMKQICDYLDYSMLFNHSAIVFDEYLYELTYVEDTDISYGSRYYPVVITNYEWRNIISQALRS